MKSRFWISLCLVFFACNLISFISDSNPVSYIIVEENDKLYDNHMNYMVCCTFETIKYLDFLKHKLKFSNVTSRTFLTYAILSIRKVIKESYKFDAKDLFKLNETYIFNNHFCARTTKDQIKNNISLKFFLKLYGPIYLFIYSNGSQPFFLMNLLILKTTIYIPFLFESINKRSIMRIIFIIRNA